MLSGRLQGGFSAPSLPRSRPSGHVAGENVVITFAVPSPSASNSEIPSNQSQEGTSSSDIQTQLYSRDLDFFLNDLECSLSNVCYTL